MKGDYKYEQEAFHDVCFLSGPVVVVAAVLLLVIVMVTR